MFLILRISPWMPQFSLKYMCNLKNVSMSWWCIKSYKTLMHIRFSMLLPLPWHEGSWRFTVHVITEHNSNPGYPAICKIRKEELEIINLHILPKAMSYKYKDPKNIIVCHDTPFLSFAVLPKGSYLFVSQETTFFPSPSLYSGQSWGKWNTAKGHPVL